MQNFNRVIALSALLFSQSIYAEFFLDALYWRATESNNWVYVNNLSLPNQTVTYKTIDFNYAPGFRIGASYINTWDVLFSYTRFYTSTSDSAAGNLQPSFSGSVTAKPSPAYLYPTGQVKQSINFNMFDLDFGKRFYPTEALMIHPYGGLIGGWISQTITAAYQGSTSTDEKITNNFTGGGPKVGVDTAINFLNNHNYQPKLLVGFASSYVWGRWNINDVTHASTPATIYIDGGSNNLGALTLQGSIGIKVEYKKFAVKLAYEINDWFNQNQFFDNDTGTHNNDLILQGLTLGVSWA